MSVIVFGASDRSLGRTLRRHSAAWASIALLAAAALVATRGDPTRALGAYWCSCVYSPIALIKWLVWSTATLEFAVAVVPLMLFPVALSRMLREQAGTRERAFGAVALSMILGTVLSTALISASPYGLDRLHERNLFYVTPLPRSRTWSRPAFPASLRSPSRSPALLGLRHRFLPRLALGDFVADVPTALLWRNLVGSLHGVPLQVAMAATAFVAAVWVIVSRKAVVPVVSVILVSYAVIAMETRHVPVLTRSQTAQLSWVNALPRTGRATIVYVDLSPSGCAPLGPASGQQELETWTEFFNVKVDRVVHLFGENTRGLASIPVRLGEDGTLTADGRPLGTSSLTDVSSWSASASRAWIHVSTRLNRPVGGVTPWRSGKRDHRFA